MSNLFYQPTRVEKERRKRIKLCVYAYTYEFLDDPVASDAEFDALVREIDLTIRTGDALMDDWFDKEFEADTGRWIHSHPNLDRIDGLARKYYYERQPI